MDKIYKDSLAIHELLKGKIDLKLKKKIETMEDLSLLYSPGVAQPCLEIFDDVENSYKYTWKSNTIAVISNGSAVLGLGNIGAAAAMPVMEGKAALFKTFGDVNAIPLCLDTQDSDEFIRICQSLASNFGGINLEDIKAPECVYIENELIKTLDIPVFHDDQHGTAVVVLAGLINAFRLTGKKFEEAKFVISGIGAAGSAIIKILAGMGATNMLAFNSQGILRPSLIAQYNFLNQEMCNYVNLDDRDLTLREAMAGADVFIGVSVKDIIDEAMVASMNKDAIVFAMANPEPEIHYDLAKRAGARVVGTGRSDFPNQVNNVLAFPGIFKGVLESRIRVIGNDIKIAAAKGLAELVSDEELSEDFVLPTILDPRVSISVAEAVKRTVEKKDEKTS